MSFRSPEFLAAVLIVPFVIAAYLVAQRRRRRYAVRFSALDTLASVIPKTPGWRRHLPPALLCTALAALGVALARPETSVSVPRDRASVVLVTDVSASMEASDVAPTRLRAAQQAANRFLDKAPKGLRIGAVAFSNEAQTLQRPTDDRQTVRDAISTLQPGGGTATGNGIRAALRALQEPGRTKVPGAIVLLSDGQATSGLDPIAQAREAKKAKVPIYTVALGTPNGVISRPDPIAGIQSIPVPPDPGALQQIAQTSGGKAFQTGDAAKLSTVYESLSAQIGKKTEKREITAGFAGGALLLVLLAGAFSLRWFGRLP